MRGDPGYERGPIPGFALADATTLYGDQIERVVTWKTKDSKALVRDLSELTGKPVRLRFTLSDADLHSLRFR